MTDDEVNALISEVDQNQDGLIDYKEFLEMMMGPDFKYKISFEMRQAVKQLAFSMNLFAKFSRFSDI